MTPHQCCNRILGCCSDITQRSVATVWLFKSTLYCSFKGTANAYLQWATVPLWRALSRNKWTRKSITQGSAIALEGILLSLRKERNMSFSFVVPLRRHSNWICQQIHYSIAARISWVIYALDNLHMRSFVGWRAVTMLYTTIWISRSLVGWKEYSLTEEPYTMDALASPVLLKWHLWMAFGWALPVP